MEITIHCPSCSVRLMVPSHLEGRSGRCRKCGTRFRVPRSDSAGDSTITDWLGEGFDNEDEDDASTDSPPESRVTLHPRAADPAGSDGSDGADGAASHAGRGSSAGGSASDRPSDGRGDPPRSGEERKPGRRDGDSAGNKRERGRYRVHSAIPATPRGPDPEDEYYRRLDAEEKRARLARQRERERERAGAAPADRRGGEPIRLDVREAGPGGVWLSFAPALLRRPAFRASVPFHCLSCGEDDPGRLLARPMVWAEKIKGGGDAAHRVEAVHQQRVRGRRTAAEVVRSMQPIEELPPPFNEPMPWFACERCARKVSVHGRVVSADVGDRCEVVLPWGLSALTWLGRVNGVCGEEYLQLESELLHQEDSAWRRMDEKVRERVSVWFDLKGGESFLGYFSDGDFVKADAGLGGVVLTDHRLVYCKYHNHGEIPLDADGELRAVEDGIFRNVAYHHDGHKRKLVRLRARDWEALVGHLRELDASLHPRTR